MAFGQSIDQRKQNKRNHVVDLFRSQGELSKAAARQLSGYSMDTLISLFRSLEEEGYIVPASPASGGRGKGRPAELYKLNPERELYLGMTFNRSGAWSALVSFSGEELDSQHDELPALDDQESLTALLADHLDRFLDRNAGRAGALRRGGLSLPGYIDCSRGVLSRYNLMPFLKDLDLRPLLARRFPDLPIAVEHNITGLAHTLLKDKELIDAYPRVLYVSARSGAAHALIQDGRLVMHDGETGHLAARSSDALCTCGRRGCLDTVFSAAEFHRLCPHSSWEQLALILGSDSAAAAALRPIVEPPFLALAEALLDLSAAFSPDLLVLSGELFSILPDAASWMRERLAGAFAGPTPPWIPRTVVYRKTGAENAAVGLCHSLIDEEWSWQAESSGA